jgi:hypothetical protein
VLSSCKLLVSVETSCGQEIYAEVSLLLWRGKRFACQRRREDWVCLIFKSVTTVLLPNSFGTSTRSRIQSGYDGYTTTICMPTPFGMSRFIKLRHHCGSLSFF